MILNNKQHVAFVFHSESLGDVAAFPLTVNQMRVLSQSWARERQEVDSREFVKSLISMSTCPSEDVIDGVRPNESSFPTDLISRLSDDDLERFSERYAKIIIGNNEVESKGVGATSTESIHVDDVRSVKIQGESFVDYVSRVEIDRIAKLYPPPLMIDLASACASKKISNMFSGDLRSMIDNSLSAGKRLREMTGPSSRFNPEIQPVDVASITRRNAEALQRPFEPLYEKFESLNSITGQTGELLALMNETQTRIATELKRSSDDAAVYSRKSFKVNIVIVVFTFFSLIAAAVSAYYAVCGSDEKDRKILEHASALEANMVKIVDVNVALQDKIEKLMSSMSKDNKRSRSTNLGNEKLMDETSVVKEGKK